MQTAVPKPTPGPDRALVQELDRATGGAASRHLKEHGPARSPRVSRILVALDGSKGSKPALAWALALARAWDAKLHLVSVAPPWRREEGADRTEPHLADAIYHEYEEEAERILAKASEAALAAGVPAQARVERGDPAAKIRAAAARVGADLLVLGSHGHGGLERLMVGSVADKLRHQAPCSVLLARALPGERPVLAAVDGSWASLVALDAATQLAHALGAGVEALHVSAAPAFGAPRKAAASTQVRAGLRVTETVGSPAAAILRRAREGRHGLVVLASRGLGGVRGALLGSISNKVSHAHKGSVLVVKPAAP